MNETRKTLDENFKKQINNAGELEPGSAEQYRATHSAAELYEKITEEDNSKREFWSKIASTAMQTCGMLVLGMIGFGLEFGANGMTSSDGMKNLMKEIFKHNK